MYSPIGLRAEKPLHTTMQRVGVTGVTAESLERDLKEEWHSHNFNKFFHDAHTFVAHVMSKLGL